MPSRPTHIPTETSLFATWLRLPMAILVVTAHLDVPGLSAVTTPNEMAYVSLLAVFDIVSHGAVGVFFILSGYLYFATTDGLDGPTYLRKLRSRARTLALPYLLWNTLIYILTALIVYRMIRSGQNVPVGLEDTLSLRRFLEAFWCWGSYDTEWSLFGLQHVKVSFSLPIDLPLWFIRCLLLLTLIAPAIYAGLRRLGRGMVAITAFFFLANVWISNLVPEISGLFFFTLGAWFGLRKDQLTELFAGRRRLIALIALAALGLEIYGGITANEQLIQALHPLAQLAMALMLLTVGALMFSRGLMCWALPLAGSSFFVYAAHYPYLTIYSCIFLRWFMGLFGVTLSPGSVVMAIGSWLLSVAAAIGLWYILRRIAPAVANAFSGGRA